MIDDPLSQWDAEEGTEVPAEDPESYDRSAIFQMADDGSGKDIEIPSVFLSAHDGDMILKTLRRAATVRCSIFAAATTVEGEDSGSEAETTTPEPWSTMTFPIRALQQAGMMPDSVKKAVGNAFRREGIIIDLSTSGDLD